MGEDVELIEGLEESKRISNEIQEKMVIAKKTQEDIAATSEKYRNVAKRGALLFFMMNQLNLIHVYYMYSLNAFVVIFLRGIDLVSQKPEKKGKSLLSRFKKAVKKVIVTQRFSWNTDLLRGARMPDEGADMLSLTKKMKKEAVKPLTDEELAARVLVLENSITSVVFNYIRRGLFENAKLMVATLMTLQIFVRSGEITPTEMRLLVMGPLSMDPGSAGSLSEWMPAATWARVKGLEEVKPTLENIGDDMQKDSEDWQIWFDSEKPENEPIPGDYKDLGQYHRVLLLRALRPDRCTAELQRYITSKLGRDYVQQPAFDMAKCYQESSPSTPIFFVLFPGVDPTPDVERLAKSFNVSEENGKFLNISMGQGQEEFAETSIQNFASKGGWIMLQNVHLMPGWLPRLERALEVASEDGHDDFRCFISAEPPSMPTGIYAKIIPESLLQSCIKVANEAPADLQSNLRRAWANFSQERLDGCSKPEPFKVTLFALCLFHALVVGRRKFGQQGWSRKYSFNTGDLTICANVLESYINNAADVPWDDLRYIFGEIMYGGHITDAWDRRTNNTYLKVLLRTNLFKNEDMIPCREGLMVPGTNEYGDEIMVPAPMLFASPKPEEANYDHYKNYIEENLPDEAPVLFGMHPNAEIGYLSNFCTSIFSTILILQGGAGGGEDQGGASGDPVREWIKQILDQLPENFSMLDINEKAEPLLLLETSPFVVNCMQECQRMNKLLSTIRDTLVELGKELDGALNMSEPMEGLAIALRINQVPGRNPLAKASWEKFAWWSKKSLPSWFQEVLRRVEQLSIWSEEITLPFCMWLPGLFNPMAFNTSVMQVTRRTGQALYNMCVETHVTSLLKKEQANYYPESGAFIHGSFPSFLLYM